MDKQEIAKMKRRVATLQRQMAKLGPLMRGSVVIIGTRNKQSYFSLNKNRGIYFTQPTTIYSMHLSIQLQYLGLLGQALLSSCSTGLCR